MSNSQSASTSNGVRCFLCVCAGVSVVALVIAAMFGATITFPLAFTVGTFATTVTHFAFKGGGSG